MNFLGLGLQGRSLEQFFSGLRFLGLMVLVCSCPLVAARAPGKFRGAGVGSLEPRKKSSPVKV